MLARRPGLLGSDFNCSSNGAAESLPFSSPPLPQVATCGITSLPPLRRASRPQPACTPAGCSSSARKTPSYCPALLLLFVISLRQFVLRCCFAWAIDFFTSVRSASASWGFDLSICSQAASAPLASFGSYCNDCRSWSRAPSALPS